MDFPIRLQPGLWPILILFGVRPGNATVRLDGDHLVALFGFFRAETSVAHGGVRLHFREPVRIGPFHVTDLYLTVDDLEGLGAALAAQGIAGQDLRTRR